MYVLYNNYLSIIEVNASEYLADSFHHTHHYQTHRNHLHTTKYLRGIDSDCVSTAHKLQIYCLACNKQYTIESQNNEQYWIQWTDMPKLFSLTQTVWTSIIPTHIPCFFIPQNLIIAKKCVCLPRVHHVQR